MGELEQKQRRIYLAAESMLQDLREAADALDFMLGDEAFRHLPKLLVDKHKISVTGKMIRRQVGNQEINLLAEGARGQIPVLIVGEVKSQLTAQDFTQLKNKIKEVEKHYPAAAGREIVPIMVVHSAREKELQRAEREGVIVVQSFEW